MVRSNWLRAGLLASVFCGLPALAAAQIHSASGVTITNPADINVSSAISLGVDKSTVIELDRPAADVVITNADIADAVVQTRQRIIFRGVSTGSTDAFIYDENGETLLALEIRVETNFEPLNALIERHVPNARVKAESVNGSVVLTGFTESVSQIEQVRDLVKLFGGEQIPIVNMVDVAAKDQVLLEVRIVEMQRSYLKRLGLEPSLDIRFGDLAGQQEVPLFTFDPTVGEFVNSNTSVLGGAEPFSNTANVGFNNSLANGAGVAGSFGYNNLVGSDIVQADVDLGVNALERIGVARTLAEPNITAVSGETANFLAGGEFPIPAPADNGQVGIIFKQFGVGLGFTPIVLSENRISLKVATEVSELTNEGSVNGVPGLTVRRVQSTVELPSGQSMMLAGLIQSGSLQDMEAIPGLKEVPVLGSLFTSREFQNSETELVVIITPFLVDPTTKEKLKTPADGFAYASDPQANFFGKINRLYGAEGAPVDDDAYQGPVGFIEE
ncbi:MAG: type II and III secretion system protein family protein [Pseudomonadota bacterium]